MAGLKSALYGAPNILLNNPFAANTSWHGWDVQQDQTARHNRHWYEAGQKDPSIRAGRQYRAEKGLLEPMSMPESWKATERSTNRAELSNVMTGGRKKQTLIEQAADLSAGNTKNVAGIESHVRSRSPATSGNWHGWDKAADDRRYWNATVPADESWIKRGLNEPFKDTVARAVSGPVGPTRVVAHGAPKITKPVRFNPLSPYGAMQSSPTAHPNGLVPPVSVSVPPTPKVKTATPKLAPTVAMSREAQAAKIEKYMMPQPHAGLHAPGLLGTAIGAAAVGYYAGNQDGYSAGLGVAGGFAGGKLATMGQSYLHNSAEGMIRAETKSAEKMSESAFKAVNIGKMITHAENRNVIFAAGAMLGGAFFSNMFAGNGKTHKSGFNAGRGNSIQR